MQYRAPPADAWIAVELTPFTAVYDRRSGLTHLLVEPAPQILDLLSENPSTAADLRERLHAAYELPDASDDALQARLDELIGTGLVAVA